MIYFDSSALVKRYLKEDGSDRVKQIINKKPLIVTSKLTYPEMLSAFARKYKTGDIPKNKFYQSMNRFESEWGYFLVVEIRDELLPMVKKTIMKYSVKSADAVHLSSALWFKKLIKTDITFVASDKNLLKAAISEGLHILNPQDNNESLCRGDTK